MKRVLSTFSSRLNNVIAKMKDISELRINYQPKQPMNLSNLLTDDPMEMFSLWFQEARECESIVEPNSMTLATVNKDGFPSARVVLLKGFTPEGFKFFTNYNSRKGQDLAENPNVALVFYWEPLHKQVRVEGRAEKLDSDESDKYFQSRPRGSQIGACASNQSSLIPSKDVLIQRFEELQAKHSDDSTVIERPENWGGFIIKPHCLEFWQGQQNRMHNRLLFERENSTETENCSQWTHKILSP